MKGHCKSVETGEEVCIWIEDECAPDGETYSQAWQRLFGEEYLGHQSAKVKVDWGDSIEYWFASKKQNKEFDHYRILTESFQGSSISVMKRSVKSNSKQIEVGDDW